MFHPNREAKIVSRLNRIRYISMAAVSSIAKRLPQWHLKSCVVIIKCHFSTNTHHIQLAKPTRDFEKKLLTKSDTFAIMLFTYT